MRCSLSLLFALAVSSAASTSIARASEFVEFESGPVRPLALSSDGRRLLSVNIPDNHIEIFALTDGAPSPLASVPVGLEPVAVALRNDSEAWVVNHLSDSVSIIDLGADPPRVIRTLLVGDEPRDIVFAGPNHERAFITTAHRGQNLPIDPQSRTPGVGRADVWCFDATNLGDSLGGDAVAILTLFSDTPRALAASVDGTMVYAAAFHSGNQTTIAPEAAVCDGGEPAPPCEVAGISFPGGLPAPNTNFEGVLQPETGLIVKWNPQSLAFEDTLQRPWPLPLRLPDKDVFVIDAMAMPPREASFFAGVGTILFNMAVNPATGAVYVTNSEARNEVRFEGDGVFAGSSVRGHLHEARISILRAGQVETRHLNKHIDYSEVPSRPGVKERSLALPLGMAVSADGTNLYVAAFGSDKIGVFDTGELEDDTFVPDDTRHIDVSGGGPGGLVLDEARGRLYVMTRFDNGISTIDLALRRESQHLQMHNPEPPAVVRGRRFLYDARLTSSNGEASCGSCHIFGDWDSLAWDLGDPDANVVPNPNPVIAAPDPGPFRDFYPLKGPMTTQTLRGMANHGPMHWRGDRTGGNLVGGDPFDEVAAFQQFNPAFRSLIGNDRSLSNVDMQAFAEFILQIVPPPNPLRALDNSLTAEQEIGHSAFVPPGGDCSGCHVLDPARGFFGTDGSEASNSLVPQFMKVPQLRTIYQKVGHFFSGGDEVRGFGFFHDGQGFDEIPEREMFLLVFDSNLAPIVGQQVTLGSSSNANSFERLDLFMARAAVGECDVAVKGTIGSEARGWYRTASGAFQSDRIEEPPLTDGALRQLALIPEQQLTFTAVPRGSGRRIGVDRDGDGAFDRDEIDGGSDPSDALSLPGGPLTPTPTMTATPLPRRCHGDCDTDGFVTAAEIVRGIEIALGQHSVASCGRADRDGDGAVTIEELIASVSDAAGDCRP